jgi:hypothetical protein
MRLSLFKRPHGIGRAADAQQRSDRPAADGAKRRPSDANGIDGWS